jgi:sec-independent protein translocase protein TatA
MLPSIGPAELIVVLVIALVVLGPKRLPDAGRSIGKGMREFKDAISGGDKDELEPGTFAAAAAAPQAPAAVAVPAPVAPEQRPVA